LFLNKEKLILLQSCAVPRVLAILDLRFFDLVSSCHCLSSRFSSPSANPAGPALGFLLASLAGPAPAVLFSALVSLFFGAVLRRVRLRLAFLSVLAVPRTSDPPAVRRLDHSCSHILLLKSVFPVHFPIVGSSNPNCLLRC
jgi:hypothetical protein